MKDRKRFPPWLRKRYQLGTRVEGIKKILRENSLHSVCEEARCPNIGDCFSKSTATFLILGDICTRNCYFCNVKNGDPQLVNSQEPRNLAKVIKKLNLNYVVITSVTRDDLNDGGASQFVKTILAIREESPETVIELLVPDFKGEKDSIEKICLAKPQVMGHNLETVPRLHSRVRKQANYQRSLGVLKMIKEIDKAIYTKSGLMVGMGEKKEEVFSVMEDLKKVQCDFLFIGQYLQPQGSKLSVKEYIHPSVFKEYKKIAINLGFKSVFSAPYVRSSYQAKEIFEKV